MHTVPGGCMSSTFELRDAFFNMSNYFLDNGQGMERILFGLLHQESQAYDQFVTEDVTNFLRANDSLPRDDLLSRNIQRAREHGLPGYNNFRSQFCDLPISCNWDTAPEGVSADKWSELQILYDNPGDIDLFTGEGNLIFLVSSCPLKLNYHFFQGGLAEKPASGAVVGPTFQCLIGEQFRRAKFGDRFFFTHRTSEALKTPGFNNRQLNNLKGRRLGDILCDNTEFEMSKQNVFLQGKLDLPCCSINKLDLSLFV